MLRRPVIILFLALLLPSAAYSQKDLDYVPPLKERLFFGGSFGLQFGTITDIQVSPLVGIWVLPRLGVAAGPNYRYYSFRSSNTHIYGGRSYIQYVFLRDISTVIPIGLNTGMFLHGEYELLSLESAYWKDPYMSGRFTTSTFLVGAGLSQQTGSRSSLNFMVLWPVNDSGYGIYSNPEIRVSFLF